MQKEAYLLELARYVVLNPLRANMVASLDDWHWSSYFYSTAQEEAPTWLDTDSILNQFGSQRHKAINAYCQFVLVGQGLPSPMLKIRHQLLLGDNAFLAQHRPLRDQEELQEFTKSQRRLTALSLEEYQERYPDRSQAMAQTYLSGAYTMAEIARHFGVHYMTVSRAVRKFEK